jgi:ATP diphosphatase
MREQSDPLDMRPLLQIMRALRDPETGCPWDLQQHYATIVPHTLEEAYEVADTIEQGDLEALPGELGDLLFQIIFYAQIGAEEGRFDFADVVAEISQKLVRRHPHVFAQAAVDSVEAQSRQWEQLKQQERSPQGGRSSLLEGVLRSLPALTRAGKIQRRAAQVDFDWPDSGGVLDKVEEEFTELREVLEQGRVEPERVAEEFGDLLFSMVNLGRHLGLDSEGTLRRATTKFEDRFRTMEQLLQAQGVALEGATSGQMEQAWQAVKSLERNIVSD